jgi:glucosamine--fructose-6-phosphate aminotransferase (isomerizing)
MCGIVGYVGRKPAIPVLIDGLKRLEYRGYDSAGIAYLNGDGLEIHKTKGRIESLEELLPSPLPATSLGIGHTRWATHGAPSSENAHPHSCHGIAVVHNGIIENYRELKDDLISQGHEFTSETDTEVIPRLIYKHMKDGLPPEEAIKSALIMLKGSFALGIICSEKPGTLFAVRNGSPLVLGVGEGEFFFASDVPAILPYTRKFLFLEDGHISRISAEGFQITSLNGGGETGAETKIVRVDWTPSMAEKEGCPHFMLKEIYEQPAAVANTLGEWIEKPDRLLDALGLTPKTALALKRVQITACGTSYHAALAGKYMLESLAHIPVDVDIASEYRYREQLIEPGSLFLSITQSGETADTLAAQREASRKGAVTLTICNVVGSSSEREADHVLHTRAGPEIGVASTKAFTAQLAALGLLVLVLGMKKGRFTRGESESLKSQLKKIPALIEKSLKSDAITAGTAERFLEARDFLYLARGINYPIALEGALKLKEISYIHAEGYPAGEMKHGPIALIEKGLPIIVLAPVDKLFEKTLSNIEEVKARGGTVIAVTDEPKALHGKADEIIQVPSAHTAFSPFVNIIPLQLFAYHMAVLRGCDVDKPRNLAKSVTVE